MRADVVIIGGGASGLAAAIAAGRAGRSVVVLERLPRVGKKIAVTGNGRCNLSHLRAAPSYYNHPQFVTPILTQFDAAACERFFDSLGLALTVDADERIFPRSRMASSVLNALRAGAKCAGAELVCNCCVAQIRPQRGGFLLGQDCQARRVVLATGGAASPALGSNGSGFALLRQLGHTVVPPRPALAALLGKHPCLASLAGLRARVALQLEKRGQPLAQSHGEILFCNDGISGIAAMELAREAHNGACLVIDFLPEYTKSDLQTLLEHWQAQCPQASLTQLLGGLLPQRIAEAIVHSTQDPTLAGLLTTAKSFFIEISGSRGFEHAQVCAGGASTLEFDPTHLHSLRVPSLYACGELLDIDAPCGGFNLHWAWASGLCAGAAAADFHHHPLIDRKEPNGLSS